MATDWLDDIEAQADETSPYYLPRLIAEIRRLRREAADALRAAGGPTPGDKVCPHPEQCCLELSRVWRALGISEYNGKSASENVAALREKAGGPRDIPGWNVLTLRTIDRVVRTTCSAFRGSDHGNARPHTTGESVRCLNCNEPQWKHWLESARVTMAEWARQSGGPDLTLPAPDAALGALEAGGPEPGRGAWPEKSHATSLADEIASALNRHSAENESNTPDFILAKFLLGCLAAWDNSTRERERWYGRSPNDGPLPAPSADATRS